MLTMFIVVSIVATLSLATALFFGVEYKKKFAMMYSFTQKCGERVAYFWYPGASRANIEPGMYKIMLCWNQPFTALIGFELKVPYLGTGFDYYGLVDAVKQIDGRYYAVFSTYLGWGTCQFMFLLNSTPAAPDAHPEIIASYQPEFLDSEIMLTGELAPTAIYPAHWYQKIGLFG